MGDVTHAELKDAIRIAGDMEKALYGFRDLGKFLAIYSKAISDEEKSGPRRAGIAADISKLEERAQAAKALVTELSGAVESAKAARAEREAAAEALCNQKVANFELLTREAQRKFEDLRRGQIAEVQALNSELEVKKSELASTIADIDALKKRLG